MNSIRKRRLLRVGEHWLLLVVAVVSFAACFVFARIDLDFYRAFSDLGSHIYVFERVFRGDIPYRDLWQNDTPALFYLGALTFRIFGTSLYAAKVLLAVCVAVSIIILFLIAKKIMPAPFAAAVAFVSLFWSNLLLNIPYGGWFSGCFGLLALLAFLHYQEKTMRSSVWLLLSGVSLGMAFSFKQHVGLLCCAAIAFVTAIDIFVREEPQDEIEPRHVLFRWLTLVLYFALFMASMILLPLVFLRKMTTSINGLDFKNFVVFFLPLFAFNLLAARLFYVRIGRDRKEINYSRIFAFFLKRESLLAVGFLLPVLPWYIYFSRLLGWKNFLQIITLTHPQQQSFYEGYFGALRLPSLPASAFLQFAFLFSMCIIVLMLFHVGNTRRRLGAAILAFVFFLVASYRLFFPLHSDFAPVYYVPLILEAGFFFILYREIDSRSGWIENRKETIPIFALAVYSVFGYLSLIILVDKSHFQMLIFPWLAAAGYFLSIIYRWTSRSLRDASYFAKIRRFAILFTASLPFLLLFIGKPCSLLKEQYLWNREYCSRHAYPNEGINMFKDMREDRGGIYVNGAFLKDLEMVVHYLQENSAERDSLFGGPAINMLNFLTGMPFPSRHRYFIFGAVSSLQQYEVAADLMKTKPRFFVYDNYYETNPQPSIGMDSLRIFPPIGDYLSRAYTFDRKIGRFYLYKRKYS